SFGLRIMFLVESRLCRVDCLDIVHRPGGEAADRLLKGLAELGQLIVDPRRNRRGDRAADQTVALEIAKGQRQHALRYTWDLAAELIEALRSAAEGLHDQ